MSSSSDTSIASDVLSSKLSELHYIVHDPLLGDLEDDKSDKHKDRYKSIEDVLRSNDIRDSLLSGIEKYIFHPKLKRKIDDEVYQSNKVQKVQISKSPSFSSARRQKSAVQSLKIPAEVDQEELDEFLMKDVKDLEIISVPEHYPTKQHIVSSLAELYYLTQTLPLTKLLPGSHKVLVTDNFESALLEGKIAVLYSRIEELKRQGKWSLRQPQKFYDPFTFKKKTKKNSFHWDNLLQEAKWMSEDFKESSKFKKFCCVLMANAIEEYWIKGKSVCIKRKKINVLEEDSEMKEESVDNVEEASVDVEDLLKPNDDDDEVIFSRSKPAAIEVKKEVSPFKPYIDINDLKKIDQSIIKNLPKFSAFDDSNITLKPVDTPLVAVSRLLHPFEEEEEWYKVILKEQQKTRTSGPPEYQKGLFGFQSHRRFNPLKPPKPPLIKNIEYRSPTIWLPQDDKFLIHYVAEFCFNWELISEHLLASNSSSSLKKYESNIERRTPWQCFERYIQLNEKFQVSDMKGLYAYHAQQWLEQAHRAQSTTKRRISPLGVGSESIQRGHRRLRWGSMFDAMRKAMKKREVAAAKAPTQRRPTSDYSAGSPAPGQMSAQVKRPVDRVPNPAELSKLKYERDKSVQEAYMNQQATRSRMMAAVAQQQKQSQSLQSGNGSNNSSANSINNNNANRPLLQPQSQAQAQTQTQSQPQSQIQTPIQQQSQINTSGNPIPQQSQGRTVSNASDQQTGSQQGPSQAIPTNPGIKRPTTPNGTPYTTEQIQQLLQFQKQRRFLQQHNKSLSNAGNSQQGPVPIQNNLIKSNVPGQGPPQPVNNGPNQGPVAVKNPVSNVPPTAPNSKPRIHFAPAQVSAIIQSIQQKNPGYSKEQVTKLAAQYLANIQQQQQNRFNQQQMRGNASSSSSPNPQYASVSSQGLPQSQQKPQGQQVTNLLPQERNQLLMLKAAKSSQQQQQFQQQLQQQQQFQQLQQAQLQQRNVGGSLDSTSISKLEYEQRKRLLIQKQQQQQLQQQQLQQQQKQQLQQLQQSPHQQKLQLQPQQQQKQQQIQRNMGSSPNIQDSGNNSSNPQSSSPGNKGN
ncbi:hypothetical protein DFJ63DRAFT_290132 [Scheffersomyces coipomensis]|uniref:uncharacterized protein n=1 Tax=Scheffersomyces coipomensis TaxID=1788519 RepID=UPI00315D1F9E